jgi:hypothetical protein
MSSCPQIIATIQLHKLAQATDWALFLNVVRNVMIFPRTGMPVCQPVTMFWISSVAFMPLTTRAQLTVSKLVADATFSAPHSVEMAYPAKLIHPSLPMTLRTRCALFCMMLAPLLIMQAV